ncbi:MAG: AI-2E family transporter [Gemmatimonadota bacterium]|nr:MAG: AI-2E family transporter [Gemmatimonadota bacterium]
MTEPSINPDKFRKAFLLILALAISYVFFQMVRGFLTAIVLAAIIAGMTQPLYRMVLRWFKGRRAAASGVTVVIVLLVIVLPLTGFLGLVAKEAVEVSQTVRPTIEELVAEPNEIDRLLQRVPFMDRLEPYRDQIIAKVGEWAGRLGSFLVNSLAATTRGTAVFFFQLFIMLYALFFFLSDGRAVLDKILYYMPLAAEDENRMVEKFVSVARATVKGTLVIGILQGGLAGLAFAVVGIGGAVFWGTIMAVLSIIPGVGTALVWLPAVGYLLAVGRAGAAIGLFVWCAAVVGTVDNLLRPWLVGKDTKMPDLLILLGTLGGLVLFGAVGIVIGPIIAALFVTIWEIYGVAFKEYLPAVRPIDPEGQPAASGLEAQ